MQEFYSIDGLIHWEAPEKISKRKSLYYYQAKSADIEITSYALMAYVGGQSPFGTPIEKLNIVKWIIKQRNPDGGFSSTQVG